MRLARNSPCRCKEKMYNPADNYQKQVQNGMYSMVRPFTSPQNRTITDYNSFMVQQKKHPKVQYASPRRYPRNEMFSPSSNRFQLESEYRNEILLKQNDYLIQELMSMKERQSRYQKKIKELKFQKVKRNTTEYVSIEDRQNIKQKEWNDKTYTSFQTLQTLEGSLDWSKVASLDDSLEYIKHTGKHFANEVDLANDKLCRLLQESSCEDEYFRKQQKRKEIVKCVQELKQLKKYHQEITS